MPSHLVLAIIFSCFCISIKLSVFLSGNQYNTAVDLYIMYLNLLLILVCIYLSIRSYKRKNKPTGFLEDVKAAAKSAALFALILSCYTFIHYKTIDTKYLSRRIEERMEMAQTIDESLLKNNPKQFTKEQFLEKEKAMSKFIFSPFNHASFVLFGYLLIGLVYSIFITALVRKFPLLMRIKD